MSGIRANILAAAAGACICGAASAATVTYGFGVVEDNSPADFSGQLFVSVSDQSQSGGTIGANQVSFLFQNIGSLQSSITDVYFDDGTLLGIATVVNSSGVAFSQGGSPPEMPGGNTIGFETTAGFLADSDSPAQPNGVNNTLAGTEWVEIVFDLLGGVSFADTIAAINGGTDLRIGLHLQGLADGQSETYVNGGPPTLIPLPSTAGLAAAGLLLVGARRRR
jgi:hypothetical protein